MVPEYTVVLRGQRFQLDREQVEFDSPNYFTSCFLGDDDPAATTTTEIELNRSPVIFALIVDYLSGYPILPLDARALGMSESAAQRYLLADAVFYELDGLREQLTEPQLSTAALTSFASGTRGPLAKLEDVVRGKYPPGCGFLEEGFGRKVGESYEPVLVHAQNMPIRVLFSYQTQADYYVKFVLGLTVAQGAALCAHDTRITTAPSTKAYMLELEGSYVQYVSRFLGFHETGFGLRINGVRGNHHALRVLASLHSKVDVPRRTAADATTRAFLREYTDGALDAADYGRAWGEDERPLWDFVTDQVFWAKDIFFAIECWDSKSGGGEGEGEPVVTHALIPRIIEADCLSASHVRHALLPMAHRT